MHKFIKFVAPFLITLSPSLLKANTAAEYIPAPASSIIGALPGGARFDAQTFTVEEAGVLTSVDLFAQSFGAPPASITVWLLSTLGGFPVGGVGGVLGSVSLSGSALPGFGSSTYLSVDFSSQHLNLIDGAQYAIALSGSSLYGWKGTNGGYSGGSMFTSSNSGTSYALFPTQTGDRDLGFRVSVTPAAVPDTSATPYAMAFALMLVFAALRRARNSCA